MVVNRAFDTTMRNSFTDSQSGSAAPGGRSDDRSPLPSEPHTAEVGNRRCTPINADVTREHPRASAFIGGFRLLATPAPFYLTINRALSHQNARNREATRA